MNEQLDLFIDTFYQKYSPNDIPQGDRRARLKQKLSKNFDGFVGQMYSKYAPDNIPSVERLTSLRTKYFTPATPSPTTTTPKGSGGFLNLGAAFSSVKEDLNKVPEKPRQEEPLVSAVKRGWAAGDQAELINPFSTEITPEQLSETANIQKRIQELPTSAEYEAFNNAKSFGDALSVLSKNPIQIIGELTGESLSAMTNYGASRVGIGAGIGAAAGSFVPGIGTAVGAGSGLISGLADTSLALEYSGSFIQSLQEAGVDVTDPSSLQKAFEDDNLISEARSHALKKGVPIAIFDLISGGVAGKIAAKPANSLLRKIGQGSAEFAIQAALGGGGELAGQIVSGEDIQPGAILGEAFGELGTTPIEVSAGLLGNRNKAITTANSAIEGTDTGNPEINAQIDAETQTAIKDIVNSIPDAVNNETITANNEPNTQDNRLTSQNNVINENIVDESDNRKNSTNLSETAKLVGENPTFTESEQSEKVNKGDIKGTLGSKLVGEEVTEEKVPTSFNETPEYIAADNSVKAVAEELRNAAPEADLSDIQSRLNEAIQGRDNARIAFEQRSPREKSETVTQSVKQALKNQIKTFYRGVDKGVKQGQKLVNENLIPKVEEAIKTSNLSPRQTSAILSKLKKTNLFTPGSYSKLQTYIDKVVENANYADKIEQAENLRSRIRKQAKGSTLPQNIKNVSKDFAKLDVDSFDVDEYIQLADHVVNGLKPTSNSKYKAFDEFAVRKKINVQRQIQEREQLRQELGDFTEEEIADIIDNDASVDSYLENAKETKRKAKLDELRAKTDFAKIGLEEANLSEEVLPDESEIINELLNADTADMSADDMVSYIRTADNIVLNGDFSGAKKMKVKLQAKKAVQYLLKETKNAKKGKLQNRFIPSVKEKESIRTELFSLPQINDILFNNQKIAADFEQMTGQAAILEAGSTVNNIVDAKIKEFDKVLKSLNKEYKTDLTQPDNGFKLNVLAYLARGTDETSHIEQIHKNLDRTVAEYAKIEPKVAAKIKSLYSKYKDINSSEEAIEYFKKNEPAVYGVWKWSQDNLFTPEFTSAVRRNTESFYNQALPVEKNYFPYGLRRIDANAPEAGAQLTPTKTSLKPQQSSNTLEARRSVPNGNAYALDPIGGMFRAYKQTLYDSKSAEPIQLLYEVTRRPEFNEIIGGQENRNKQLYIEALTKVIAEQYGTSAQDGAIVSALNDFAHAFKDLGTAKALGGLDQIVSQTVPTWIASSWSLGNDAPLMFTSIPDEFKNDVISKSRISEAGKRHASTDLGDKTQKYVDEESSNWLAKGAEKMRNATSSLANWKLSLGLTRGDVFVRQRTFTAFYIKSLKEQGIDPKQINLKTEGSKQNEETRKKARSYADHMVSTLQVPSNRAEMSQLMRRQGLAGIVRTVMFPFSMFPLNTKLRLSRALSKANTVEGKRELAGVLSESLAFGTIKVALGVFYYQAIQAGIRAALDLEEPEKENDEDSFWYNFVGGQDKVLGQSIDWQKEARKVTTGVYNDLNPFSFGMGQKYTAVAANYAAYESRDKKEYKDYTFEEWLAETKGIVNEPYESDFSNWGVIGVGLQQLYDIGDASVDAKATLEGDESIYYNTYGGGKAEADTDGIEDLIFLNSMLEFGSLGAPREFNTAWKKVYTEQLKDYTPDSDRRRRDKRRSERKKSK